jgi:hypothetical protein
MERAGVAGVDDAGDLLDILYDVSERYKQRKLK